MSDDRDHFGGKTDEEFIVEESEFRRQSAGSLLRRWRLHPLNPASDASVRLYRGAAIVLALVFMAVFFTMSWGGKDNGGYAIAAASSAVALSIAVGARSR